MNKKIRFSINVFSEFKCVQILIHTSYFVLSLLYLFVKKLNKMDNSKKWLFCVLVLFKDEIDRFFNNISTYNMCNVLIYDLDHSGFQWLNCSKIIIIISIRKC